MQGLWDRIFKGMAAAAGALAGLFGEWTALMTVLALFMALDFLSGLVVALCGRSAKTEGGGVSSKASFEGLMKKAMIVFVVLAATLLDRVIGAETMVFQTASTCYYIANEGISLIENTALMGVPYPPAIKRAFEALRKKGEEDE